MRLILSLSMVAAIAVTGPVRAGGYFTAEQLAAALLTEAELPGDYVRGGGDAGRVREFDLFGSDTCTGGEPSRVPKAVTRAWVSFESNHGTTLDIEVTATGSAPAGQIVDSVAAAPATCPTVRHTRYTSEHSPLLLPELGMPAAGLVTVYRYDEFATESAHRAAVKCGGLSLTFDEIGTASEGQAGFAGIVKAGAEKLRGVGAPC
jgi:hypothetical protein